MLFSVSWTWTLESEQSSETQEVRPGTDKRRRRGATAMEYLFVLSLIFVAAMYGVSYFGEMTKKVADTASEAIQNATEAKGSPGP